MKTNECLYKNPSISYDKGIIYVASLNSFYYEMALVSAQSLKDWDPTSNITLYTHESFVDERAFKVFDEIRVGIPVFRRAKMWCMANTPYDVTLYNDCDSLVLHRDIKKIYDILGSSDLVFGENRAYAVANKNVIYLDKKKRHFAKWHGSFCLYRKTDLTIDFHSTWYSEYVKQLYSKTWEYEEWANIDWKVFDMFTLGRLVNNFGEFDKFKQLKIEVAERRWNTSTVDTKQDVVGKPVIVQVPKNSTLMKEYFHPQFTTKNTRLEENHLKFL